MFECSYCDAKFLTEKRFNSHKCRNKDRALELESPQGMSAFKYYLAWFKYRHLKEPSKDTFINSKYYNALFSFVKYAKKMGIPDTNIYIQFMSRENILPSHWYNDDIYKFFIDYFDNDCDPQIHARVTLKSMDRLANHFQCKICEVFDHLRGADVIKLVQSRNLSPWILLFSKRFAEYLESETTTEEQKLIEQAVSLSKWKIILEAKRNHIPEIREYIAQLNL